LAEPCFRLPHRADTAGTAAFDNPLRQRGGHRGKAGAAVLKPQKAHREYEPKRAVCGAFQSSAVSGVVYG